MKTRLIPWNYTAADIVQGHPLYDDAQDVPRNAKLVAVTGKTKRFDSLLSCSAVETLWVGIPTQAQILTVAKLHTLKTLCLRGTIAGDFTPLAQLSNLEILIIEDAVRLEDLGFLKPLANLRALHISDAKRLTDIGPIGHVERLVELTLAGGIWNRLALKSLEPLRQLASLEYLGLFASMKNGSLEPLRALQSLEELQLNDHFALEEYAKLSGFLPHVQCDHFVDLFRPFPHKPCKKCQNSTLLQPKHTPSRMLCRDCDAAKIAAVEARFRDIAETAKATQRW